LPKISGNAGTIFSEMIEYVFLLRIFLFVLNNDQICQLYHYSHVVKYCSATGLAAYASQKYN